MWLHTTLTDKILAVTLKKVTLFKNYPKCIQETTRMTNLTFYESIFYCCYDCATPDFLLPGEGGVYEERKKEVKVPNP